MSYMTLPNPSSKASKTEVERKLKNAFQIKQFNPRSPILAIDFGCNYPDYCALLDGSGIDKLNSVLKRQATSKFDGWRKVSTKIISVIMSYDEVAMVEVEFTYATINGKQHVACAFDNICLLQKFRYPYVPSCIENITYTEMFSSFQLAIISDINLKESIYSVLYNLFYIGRRLYVNANVKLIRYPTLLVAEYLTAITSLLQNVGCAKQTRVFTKIDIHSPGNILVYIEDALRICSDNWFGLLIVFVCIFGGEVNTTTGSFKMPSVRNLIEYFVNWDYERKMKAEALRQEMTKTLSGTQDIIIKNQDIQERENELWLQAQEMKRIAKDLNVPMPSAQQANLQAILDIVNELNNRDE